MKEIDHRTVELTKAELKVSFAFDRWLNEGYGCYEAVGRILVIDELPVSPRMAYWLSMGGNRSKVASVPKARNLVVR